MVVKGKFLHRVDPRVLDLAQMCEIVKMSGWTLEYIDAQPAGRLADMAAYWTMSEHYRESQRAG